MNLLVCSVKTNGGGITEQLLAGTAQSLPPMAAAFREEDADLVLRDDLEYGGESQLAETTDFAPPADIVIQRAYETHRRRKPAG